MIRIEVSGPDRSGKGYVIAAIAHALREFDMHLEVQGENTHNADKLNKSDVEIKAKVSTLSGVIVEMQTSA